MTKAERQKRMEEDLIRMKAYEERLYREGNRCGKIEYIAGVDEVGRGPLAGPVVAAAVILPPDFAVLGRTYFRTITFVGQRPSFIHEPATFKQL